MKVGLVQVNNSFSGQNYLPYSVGILEAYARKYLTRPDEFQFLLPIYRRIPVDQAVAQLESAAVVFFSAYVWNIRVSLEIARRLKALDPEKVIVFGGPQVPNRVDEFLTRHPFIDLAAHGEGEKTFLAILEHASDRRWAEVASLSFVREGAVVHTPPRERLNDLSTVPSPYLSGVFEPLMAANPREKWIVLWETNRGCPFSCTFCDWGSAVASKVFPFDLPRLEREVEWFAAKKIEFIFCADANFGILPRDLDIVKHVAATKRRLGYPHALSVQNTKNATERAYQVQSILAEAGLNKGVAISLQSTDPGTLKAIKRDNISLKSYQELQRRFTRDRVETYSDMILGLPGETYDSFVNGVASLIAGGQHNRIQFNNLSILPNAEMGDPEYQRRFGMETIESKIINIHGSLSGEEEIQETQELVVATASMPRPDWVRTRAFCWMTAFLYFDKVLQIPLTMAHEVCGSDYRELLEHFTGPRVDGFATLTGVRDFFLDEARRIQAGGPEYCPSPEWLDIYWPADEYVLIKLCAEGRLEAFYGEAERAIADFLAARSQTLSSGLLADAVRLNRSLLKVPYQTEDLTLELGWGVFEYYRAVLEGTPTSLHQGRTRYHVDRSTKSWMTFPDWCREVVWYGNKKGAYLYGTTSTTPELAGHY